MVTLMDTRVACYAAIVDADERLLLAHWNEGGRSGWSMPGGGMEPGEQPEETVLREVREETGYDVAVDGLLGVDVHEVPEADRILRGRGDLRSLRIVYTAHVVGGELRHETDGTTDEARWVPLADVPDLDRVGLVDAVLRMLGKVSLT